MIAAMVMPLMGLELLPMMPTMRLLTVTKKKPKVTMRRPSTTLPMPLPGMNGNRATTTTRPMEPATTIHKGRSFSVRFTTSVPSPPRDLMAPLKAETMVGMVLISVMKPPAATMPAPICRT